MMGGSGISWTMGICWTISIGNKMGDSANRYSNCHRYDNENGNYLIGMGGNAFTPIYSALQAKNYQIYGTQSLAVTLVNIY